MVEQGVDTAVHIADSWIEVPVNRRSHHRNDRIGLPDAGRIESGIELILHDLAQELVSPALHERHGSGIDQVDFGGIDIQQVDLQPSFTS